jgi:peptide chain release factor subunit 1
MVAVPLQRDSTDVAGTIQRLTAIRPGPHWVVSCYLKLEPRDKTAAKYRIKIKNRVRQAEQWLAAQDSSREEGEAASEDLARVVDYFAQPLRLPAARGVAVFASSGLGLFEVLPLPHVHRSRLAVDRTPLVRELVAQEEEFGRIAVVTADRTSARFFLVTAYGVEELPGMTGSAAPRAGTSAGWGEHNYNMRIRQDKQRHLAGIAEHLFALHGRVRLDGIVLGGVGNEGAALVPHLHTYLHDLVLGSARLHPKDVTPTEAREAAIALRAQREREWERAHVEALMENAGRGWAVRGIEPTLRALSAGQVRVLLADGEASVTGFRCGDSGRLSLTAAQCRGEGSAVPVIDLVDDAIEEALRQRAQVDVVYDAKARPKIDRLGALLRFRR